jgi:hypothetical protein
MMNRQPKFNQVGGEFNERASRNRSSARVQYGLSSLMWLIAVVAVFLAVAVRLGFVAMLVVAFGFLVGRAGGAIGRRRIGNPLISCLVGTTASTICVWPVAWLVERVFFGCPECPIFGDPIALLALESTAGGALGAALGVFQPLRSHEDVEKVL